MTEDVKLYNVNVLCQEADLVYWHVPSFSFLLQSTCKNTAMSKEGQTAKSSIQPGACSWDENTQLTKVWTVLSPNKNLTKKIFLHQTAIVESPLLLSGLSNCIRSFAYFVNEPNQVKRDALLTRGTVTFSCNKVNRSVHSSIKIL